MTPIPSNGPAAAQATTGVAGIKRRTFIIYFLRHDSINEYLGHSPPTNFNMNGEIRSGSTNKSHQNQSSESRELVLEGTHIRL